MMMNRKLVGVIVGAALAVSLLLGGVILIDPFNSEPESTDLFSQERRQELLWDFCHAQLRSVVDDCVVWGNEFEDIYGNRADNCLWVFKPDSALLLVCFDNIVEGRSS